ncbi:hypothetical protein Plhal710r2_c014g0064821 [Plasmopara halstedii]
MVKLFCAVVGVAGNVFSVQVDEKDSVADLKNVILAEKPNDMKGIDADRLELFLAKTEDGAWLMDDDDLDKMLQKQVDTSKMKKLRASWKLNKPVLFGPDVSLGEDVVHVLVVVPKDENDRSAAMALGVAPSLPPTTIHRHPERLKRWAAINAMIRQKNQEANQKTTSEDAKRKIHDVDKTVGYSSLCWEDIKPIYNFDDLEASLTFTAVLALVSRDLNMAGLSSNLIKYQCLASTAVATISI